MGSQHVAWLMLSALQEGCPQTVSATLAGLDRFIPANSASAEFERRDLLEGIGAQVLSEHGANRASRMLLEHLAGPDRPALRLQ